jgi:phosphoenolpyruvate carboxylase
VWRALTALPPGTVDHHVKITEQGEVISQKFGLPDIARRSLDVTMAGTLHAARADWRRGLAPEEVDAFTAALDRMADAAIEAYARVVRDNPATFQLFLQATPVRELAHVHFGSRPAYRDRGAGTMAGIRAIPWTFGWTQIRLMLSGWFGVGTALRAELARPDGLPRLRRMIEVWPFFDDLLAKVAMVLAKADLEVARFYVTQLGGDLDLLAVLEAEHQATLEALAALRGPGLIDDQPVLRASIALRNPYVDPLSLLQVRFLLDKRATPDGEPGPDGLLDALSTTLNGVAQGLRNTG